MPDHGSPRMMPIPKMGSGIPGIRKAAILLLSLGEQVSVEILRQLPESHVRKLTAEIARLPIVSPEHVVNVLEEFRHRIEQPYTTPIRGGSETARRMLVSAFGIEPAQKILSDAHKPDEPESALLGLRKADPAQVATFLQGEHPQTIALILSNIELIQAKALFLLLPPDVRAEVAMRIAKLEQVSPEVLSRVASVVGRKLSSFGSAGTKVCGGIEALTHMLGQLDPEASEAVLTKIAEEDPNLADTVRARLFVFEDLINVSKEGTKALLGKVDRKVLTMALKGTSVALKNHFMECMSQRGSDMLREDIEALGAVRIRDVETAQKQVISAARTLEAAGVLSLRETDADQYIV